MPTDIIAMCVSALIKQLKFVDPQFKSPRSMSVLFYSACLKHFFDRKYDLLQIMWEQSNSPWRVFGSRFGCERCPPGSNPGLFRECIFYSVSFWSAIDSESFRVQCTEALDLCFQWFKSFSMGLEHTASSF